MDKENFTIEEAIRHKLDDTREGRVVLGDFVTESNYGRKGRVTAIHTDCPESQSLRADILNLRDVLARSRSGAALNATEEKLYQDFIQGDPFSALQGYSEGPSRALQMLEHS